MDKIEFKKMLDEVEQDKRQNRFFEKVSFSTFLQA